MKKIFLSVVTVLLFSCNGISQEKSQPNSLSMTQNESKNIYQFAVEDISGEKFDFANLKGKKIMIVNTASECGLTPQYKELQELYEKYNEKNFVIVGFPANNFGKQEPGENEEIAAFCEKNFGVTFPMMAKISVNGEDMSEVYKFLTQKSENGLENNEVQWNFQKYLINEKGDLVKVFSPKTSPLDESIIKWLEQ